MQEVNYLDVTIIEHEQRSPVFKFSEKIAKRSLLASVELSSNSDWVQSLAWVSVLRQIDQPYAVFFGVGVARDRC